MLPQRTILDTILFAQGTFNERQRLFVIRLKRSPRCRKLSTLRRDWHDRASGLVAGVEHLESELPALECHQHRAEIVPVDAPSIDDHARPAAVVDPVPLDPPSDQRLGDPQSAGIRDQVRRRQRALDFLNELTQQRERLCFRIAEALEAVPFGAVATREFEGFQRKLIPQQQASKMELVIVAVRIAQAQRREARMLEMLKVRELGHVGVEASSAEHTPRAVRSSAHEVVRRSDHATAITSGLGHKSTG